MRALLELISPEVHEGDHETTVEILHSGLHESLAVELVRLFVYLETNSLTRRFKTITGCDVNLSTSANVMGFLRCTGFLTEANIRWLGRSTDPTSQVFSRRLLYHSIFGESSLDLLRLCIPGHFGVNDSVQTFGNHCLKLSWKYDFSDQEYSRTEKHGDLFYPQTFLQCSSLAGNIKAVRYLLELGADPYATSGRSRDFSPIECAASLARHDRATIIASLLLSKQTSCSSEFQKESIEVALRLAISRTNIALIVKLISERKRLGQETICSQHFTMAAKYGDCDMLRLLVDNAPRDRYGFVKLPEDILFTAISTYNEGPDAVSEISEKVNYLLELGADPTVPKYTHDGAESFILCRVIGWSNHSRRDANGEDHALELAEILRKHGCPPNRPKSTTGSHTRTSALQAAIFLGYSRLVKYLLDWGVDIDFCLDGFKPVRSTCLDCIHDGDWIDCVGGRSPLLTALMKRETGIAKMLLKRNPNLTLHGGEQKFAMESGDDTELVTMLLQAGSADLDGWRDFLEQAILRRNPESIELLLSMGADGHAGIGPTTVLRAALIIGDHDKAYKQIAVCGYDSRALFDAVLLSHRAKENHKVVVRLLDTRPNTSTDGFEVRAVAYAAICHDIYLLGVLMRSFGQGPWVARFPSNTAVKWPWAPGDDQPGFRMHILDYVARENEQFENETVLKTLLEVGVPAKGLQIKTDHYLAAQTWKQLIAAGADPDPPGLLPYAVEHNMVSHVEVLCEAKVSLERMHTYWTDRTISRTAVQAAVERGSPEMLRMLLQYGADVDGPAGYYCGATCLQLAVGSGNIGLVRFLLHKGAKVNAKRSLFQGRTSIEIAAELGRLDVLKLLLLQEENLFQTTAERYQFFRAAKFAETMGHTSIVQMLRQHIHWDCYDQQLFDGVRDVSKHIHLDDMTQKVLEWERRDPHYWSHVDRICDFADVDDIYDIDDIEKWIGERIEESDESTITSSYLSSGEENEDMSEDMNSLGTGQRQNELRSNQERSAQLISVDDGMHDAIDSPESMCGDPMDEHPTSQSHELALNPEWGRQATALAPQAMHYKDNVPAWINNQATQDELLQVLQLRPATQNVSREPGMVLGEVLDEMPDIDYISSDAVDQNMADNFSDGEQVQQFDWGFWDDQGTGGVGNLLIETPGMSL